jgi:hypothetical protein
MACQCGCSTGHPRTDLAHGESCECGCSTTGTPASMDVGSLARLVQELDQRVKELEAATSRV